MMDHYTWIFALSVPVAFIAAFGIGANDLANSFATSVGSKALTVSLACILLATKVLMSVQPLCAHHL